MIIRVSDHCHQNFSVSKITALTAYALTRLCCLTHSQWMMCNWVLDERISSHESPARCHPTCINYEHDIFRTFTSKRKKNQIDRVADRHRVRFNWIAYVNEFSDWELRLQLQSKPACNEVLQHAIEVIHPNFSADSVYRLRHRVSLASWKENEIHQGHFCKVTARDHNELATENWKRHSGPDSLTQWQ